MSKLNLKNKANQNIPVSNVFIENYMAKANGSFVKVYLYGLLHSMQQTSNITNRDIADALDMIESDVHNAWKYWEKLGLIKINGVSDIEFLSPDTELENCDITPPSSKPSYQPKEVMKQINDNSKLRDLLKLSENILCKPLSSNDITILYSFYDWYKLPIDVIIVVLSHCASINKRNVRYIEKIIIELVEKDIKTTEQAEFFLEMANADFNAIKNALGISGRMFTPIERSYVDKWIHEYNFDIETIILACNEAILNTGKTAIKYVDKILSDWNNNNIKSPASAKNELSKFKNENQKKYSEPQKQQKSAPNKFINYTQDKPNYEELMKQAREKRLKDMGESGA